jgi:hypothetical protein
MFGENPDFRDREMEILKVTRRSKIRYLRGESKYKKMPGLIIQTQAGEIVTRKMIGFSLEIDWEQFMSLLAFKI